jgi:transcriptional regulator with XRE-family HTH domain
MLMIQKLREDKMLTRSALARLAIMHASTVGQIENRYIGRPYPSQLKKLAVALEFSGEPRELLTELDRP